jgi:hypothetical protein
MVAGTISAAEILRKIPPEARTMSVGRLLASQHRWGNRRSNKLLLGLGVWPNRPLGKLTERQADEIATAVEATNARRHR